MNILLIAMLLHAALPSIDALPPLREGRPREMVHPIGSTQTKTDRCTFWHRRFDDSRVNDQWLAQCDMAGIAIVTDPASKSAVVWMYGQNGSQHLAVSSTQVAMFSETTKPEWLTAPLLERARRQQAELSAPLQTLATDARDGSRLLYEHSRGYLRQARGKSETTPAVFTPTLAEEAQTSFHTAWFGRESEPWLLYGVDPSRRVELHLRAPGGADQVLFELPRRESGGSSRVEQLSSVTSNDDPIFSFIVDHAHVLLWPEAKGRFIARAVRAPNWVTMTAPSETLPCSEEQRIDDEEQVVEPKLIRWRSRTLIVHASTVVHTEQHFGDAPVRGEHPADDRWGCDWVVDARHATSALVVAELTKDGHARELMRVDVGISAGRVALDLIGDALSVVTSGGLFTAVTRFDLSKLVKD